jgi:hypothetical protein
MLGAESLNPRAESYAGIVSGMAVIEQSSTDGELVRRDQTTASADQYVMPSRRSLMSDLFSNAFVD